MLTSPEAVMAIVGMALVSYAIRVTGFLLASKLPRQGFVAAWMKHIPGAVLASLVAPAIITGNAADAIAALATALIFILSQSLIAAMLAGVGTVLLVRTLLGG